MKFKINLATQAYEDARRFYLLWGALLLAVAVLTGAMIYAAVGGWRNAHAISRRVAAEKITLDKLNQQEQADLAILNKADNRDVRDRSLVLNSLIRRKEFSWTMIFADLEEIMPGRLHVVTITPKLDKNNDIEVHMTVSGDSRERAIELVHKMEESREFRRAQVLSEATRNDPRQGGDVVVFEISALYVPVAPAAQQRSGQ